MLLICVMLPICVCWQYIRSGKFTAACDVWSVGCVMIEMATRKPPWPDDWAQNSATLMYKVPIFHFVPLFFGHIPCARAFILCGQRSSLLWTPVLRPLHSLHTVHKCGLLPPLSHVGCVSVCLSVCPCVYVLGRRVSCAKTAELIEMPFGALTHEGPRNHVLNGSPDPLWERAHLRGSYAGHCTV